MKNNTWVIKQSLKRYVHIFLYQTYLVKVIATDNIYLSKSKQSFPLIWLWEESLIVICHYCVARALFFKWHQSINNRILYCLMSLYARRWTTKIRLEKKLIFDFSMRCVCEEEGRFRFFEMHLTWIIDTTPFWSA